ncbi:MAG: SBBP repeat-containing protein [Hymenobacteraceae bacterium]|nr:SBBP repeat-containing protein [Hymenobacteraceae bacterium]
MKNVCIPRLPGLTALIFWFTLLLLGPTAWGQAPLAWQWAIVSGGGLPGRPAVDAAGNVLTTGSFVGSARFGNTTLMTPTVNAFVAKLTRAGVYEWAASATIAALGTGRATGVTTATDSAGNVYVTGTFSGTIQFDSVSLTESGNSGLYTDVFVAKLSPAGAWQWAVRAGGLRNEVPTALAIDARGAVYLTGNFVGPAAFGDTTLTGAGAADVFVAKLSREGAWQWATSAGGTGYDSGAGLTVDTAGNAYVTGTFARFGRTALFGRTTLTSVGEADAFVARLSSAGAWSWAVRAGGTSDESGRSLTLASDSTGDLLVLGDFTGVATFGTTLLRSVGAQDIFVARLTTTGTWRWATEAGGRGTDRSSQLVVDRQGQAYVAGDFAGSTIIFGDTPLLNASTMPNGTDVFVAHLSGAGNWEWVVVAGGSENETASGLASDSTDSVYLTGSFSSPTLAFGPTTLPNATAPNAARPFLAHLAPPPLGLAAETTRPAALVLFPNPAHHAIALSGLAADAAVTLLDAVGRVVRTGRATAAGTLTLPVADLPPGVYVARTGRLARRVVVAAE